jgi:hypothetical protein
MCAELLMIVTATPRPSAIALRASGPAKALTRDNFFSFEILFIYKFTKTIVSNKILQNKSLIAG